MELSSFLQYFEGVHGKDGQYMAQCPAHEDKNASLSIGTGENGKILLHCQAGCQNKDILAHIGLKTGDLFPDPLQSPAKNSRGKWQFITEYIYPDENGKPKNKKIRYLKPDGKKTFVWRHYENGQWVKGKKGFVPLYNAACIPIADTVYIVEGEKDVETLKKAGKHAVCAPNGAGRDKWADRYTTALNGKYAVVIQDNDEIGKEFAGIVCEALNGQAAGVKLVDLSLLWKELPNHGDFTDYAEHLKDSAKAAEQLENLTRSLPEYRKEPAPKQETIPEFYNGKTFLHYVMGDYLIRKYHVCKINNTLHIYDNGIYRQGEDVLQGHMVELCPQLKDTQRREVYRYMKVNLKTPEKEISSPQYIPFATKIYNVETDEFFDYSPEFVFLNRFPYDYRPDAAEAPGIVDTIRDIANDDKEVEALIYEAIGNCFYLLNSFRGSVMLYGKGKNGKSTLLNMILQVVGRQNASHLSLQNLSGRFMLSEVYGKAANIGDDIPETYIPDTSTFKKVATGDPVMAEEKGKDPFSFTPYAKLFFSMNALPPVGDKSAGFFSRILIVPLNRVFEQGNGANVGLKSRKWSKKEMEYLVKLSVDGLKRLFQNGDFTTPYVVKEALAEYELENNPVKEFLQECPIKAPAPIEEVYYNYQNWCPRAGHKNQMSRSRFTREVCKMTGFLSGIKRHKYFGGNPGRCFVNCNE